MARTETDPNAPRLLALIRDSSNLRQARDAMHEDIVLARDTAGHTWREIATAVGMTEHGVADIYRRTLEQAGTGERA